MPEDKFEMSREFLVPNVQTLRELNNQNIDLPSSFRLEEKNEKGEQVEGEAFWVQLTDEDHIVEGKFYLPEKTKRLPELVIFQPGMPGDGVIRFDSRHAPELVKEGYTVFVARHNGTIVNSEKGSRYIHCDPKQRWSQEKNQHHLGRPFSFEEWGREPLTAIRALEKNFEAIHLIGHSMGVLEMAQSLIVLARKNPELIKKIKTFSSLSGLLGKVREDGRVDPEGRNTLERITGFLNYIKNNQIHESLAPEENIKQLADALQTVYQTDFKEFRDTRFRFWVPTQDEYVNPSGTNEFVEHLSHDIKEVSGLALDQPPHVEAGFESHDYENLKSEELIEFLQGTPPPTTELMRKWEETKQ